MTSYWQQTHNYEVEKDDIQKALEEIKIVKYALHYLKNEIHKFRENYNTSC